MSKLRIVGSLAGASAMVLLGAGVASSALCAHWESLPSTPSGQEVTVAFRTFLPLATGEGGYRLEPRPFPQYPFRVRAVAPNGTANDVAVSPGSGNRWVGRFVPGQEGSWSVRIVNLSGSEPKCYRDGRLRVGDLPANRLWVGVAVATALAALTGLALLLRGRWRASDAEHLLP
jgi:hypothetical protein